MYPSAHRRLYTSSMSAANLARLGFPNAKEYGIFKKYLRLPPHYLTTIAIQHSPILRGVPADMLNVVRRTHATVDMWLKRTQTNMELQEQLKSQVYRAAGVPPMYCASLTLPACAAQTLTAYNLLCQKIKGAATSGKVLYLHSTMGTSALHAAAGIVRAAVDAKLKAGMVAFPEFMDTVTEFDKGSARIKNWRELDLTCLYLLGTEYVSQTGFTEAQLHQFVSRRMVQGKPTILCSHLTPTEFEMRYSLKLASVGAVPLKFDDSTATSSLASLVKELKMI